MATTTAAPRGRSRTTASAQTAVVPASLSHDDLMALLGQTGAVAQGGEFHRLNLKAGVLETDDGDMFPPKQERDGTPLPSLTVRIVTPPVYYNALFLSADEKNGAVDAGRIGRDDLNGRFCRKYDDPAEQQRDQNPANEIYDDLVRATGNRGSFKGDMQVQILPESGQFTGDETIYTLTLSTTSVFEWRGSSRDGGEKGSVSDTNFIVRLAQFAIEQAKEAGADETGQKQAVLNALTALRLGNVVADIYLVRAVSEKDKSMTWWVISFVPVHVESGEDAPALDSGSETTGDEVPF